ncbi:peptidylprolyl isomerase [Caldithrix abyssi]
MRYQQLFLLLIFSLTFCTTQNQQTNFDVQLKTLEISRSSDVEPWQKLTINANSEEARIKIAMAIARTKEDSLFPIAKELFMGASSDSLKIAAAFALSQLNHKHSEQFLISSLQDDKISPRVKNYLIKFLANCGQQHTWNVLQEFINDDLLKEAALTTLGVLNRKVHSRQTLNIIDSAKSSLSTAEAYYLYNSNLPDGAFSSLIRLIKNSNPEAQIFLLKKLRKLLAKKQNHLLDSLSSNILYSFLQRNLTSTNSNWRLLLSAIYMAPLVKDSVLQEQVKQLTEYPIGHVRIAAYQALVEMAGKKITPFLVNQFGKLPATYEKAVIAGFLAQIDPNTAYLLINNALDKGNPYFKRTLLYALAKTKLKLSNRLLREFLKLNDPFLSNGAFSALAELNSVQTKDANLLLNSKYVSNVGTALDWYLQKRKKLPDLELLSLFKKFRGMEALEIQMSICQMFKNFEYSSVVNADSLAKYAVHPVLFKKFPKLFKTEQEYDWASYLPSFLLPDSLNFPSSAPVVEVETTKGRFSIRLEADLAPLTVKNFLHLVQKGFYNGLYFHRVVPDFVIQGGDPTGTGWGTSGYLIPSEHSPRLFERGAVGIATAGFDTGSCQFFICHSEQPHLNGNYTRFGKVIKNMNVVDQIEVGDQILSIKIVE